MIDCHCHLADEAFSEDVCQVVKRARENDVVSAVVVAEFPHNFEAILRLSHSYPDFIRPCLGLHPVQKDGGWLSVSELLYANAQVEQAIRANAHKLCAIGEIGLDFTPRYLPNGDADKKQQRQVFGTQIALAKELDLALNVHSRSAGKPVIEWLCENGARDGRVLLHAFSGNLKSVRRGLDAGFHFSVPPSFTMSEEKEPFVRLIPMDRLCLESDAPVLGPSREERNEPANIRMCAEFISRVKQLPLEEVVRVTSENAKRLFRLQ